jgi:hypothetical protein
VVGAVYDPPVCVSTGVVLVVVVVVVVLGFVVGFGFGFGLAAAFLEDFFVVVFTWAGPGEPVETSAESKPPDGVVLETVGAAAAGVDAGAEVPQPASRAAAPRAAVTLAISARFSMSNYLATASPGRLGA